VAGREFCVAIEKGRAAQEKETVRRVEKAKEAECSQRHARSQKREGGELSRYRGGFGKREAREGFLNSRGGKKPRREGALFEGGFGGGRGRKTSSRYERSTNYLGGKPLSSYLLRKGDFEKMGEECHRKRCLFGGGRRSGLETKRKGGGGGGCLLQGGKSQWDEWQPSYTKPDS